MSQQIVNALPRGTILCGPVNTYRIEEALGQGAFGITYLATTEMQVSGQMGSFTTTVRVAVKEFFMKELNGRNGCSVVTSGQGSYFTDYRRKFMNEAANLAKLNHPHIVKVLERFEADNTAYYAMEYLEGGSLSDYIHQRGVLTESEVRQLARQIGSALQCMHDGHMLHLDLKPLNIMRRTNGEAVLIDFGLSKQFDTNGEPESSTSIGGGTPGYSPMEQATYQRGDGLPVTMDIYAFGATLFTMLSGERPPKASVVFNDGFPASPLTRRGVSQNMIAVVQKAMTPAKRDRYQSIRDMLAAMGEKELILPRGYSNSKPVAVTPVETVYDQPPKHERKQEPVQNRVRSRETVMPEPQKKEPSFLTKYRFPLTTAIIAIGVFIISWIVGSILNNTDEGSGEGHAEEAINNVAHDEQAQTITVNGVSFKMIRVEGGTFTMGATSEQGSDAWNDEKPAHQVTLSSYSIGETEVTQALWQAVMGSNPSNFKGDNRPVEEVSWDDCQTFIRKLNALTGKTFRLPTEAEWEYAARGGKKSQGYKYSGSNSLGNVAWYNDNSGNETHPVKTKSPNELGIYDMSGNVWEWCQDWFGSYGSSAQMNPSGASSGSDRVYRGGCWCNFARCCRVSFRNDSSPDFRFSLLGLRLAL